MRSPLTSSSSSTQQQQQQKRRTTSPPPPPPPPAAKPSKTTPCCSKVGLKRGPWTPEEDELLSDYIKREGEGRWRTLPKRAGLVRCGKSCRLRWMNYLRPCVKRGQIAADEEDLILRLHRLLGNRWSLIAGRIPGRTDNEIKNYWNTHLSKKLISQGIDPRTHKPLDNNTTFNSNNPPNPNPNPTAGVVAAAAAHSSAPVISNSSPNPKSRKQQQQQQQQVDDDESNNISSTTEGGGGGDTTTTTTTTTPQANSPPPLLFRSSSYFDPQHPYHNHMINANTHALVLPPSGNTNTLVLPSAISINNLHLSSGLVWGGQPHQRISPDHDDQELTQNHPHNHPHQHAVEDHDLNYCTDEVFSSFLNSLINDDMFAAPPPTPTPADIAGGLLIPASSSSSSSSSSSTMVMMASLQGAANCYGGAFGAAGWDAPPLMSTPPPSASASAAAAAAAAAADAATATAMASSFHRGDTKSSCTQHNQLR